MGNGDFFSSSFSSCSVAVANAPCRNVNMAMFEEAITFLHVL
jgi:hypothetical protein